jgi:arylformamidase
MTFVFLSYDQHALDSLYDVRARVPDNEIYIERFVARSRRARETYRSQLDIRYGPHPRQRLDVFLPDVADEPLPANLFFHGGYWRASDKERYSFLADGLVPAGAAAVIVEYALIPDVDMDALVRQCREAVVWVHAHGADLGLDPNRLFISGHSAGGHLVGMLMAAGWARELGAPADVVKGGAGLSGLYDLEPIRLSFVNQTLLLDHATARANSPSLLPPAGQAPLVLAVGGDEGAEYVRQTDVMDAYWRSQGVPTEVLVLDGNHYTVVEALGDAASSLAAAVHRQMALVSVA